MVKNHFEQMKPVGLTEDYPSSNFVDWHYRITNEELFQRTKTTSLEDFQ